ncbi:MAG: malonate decarboxylase subunit alpha, partial [Gammaproteobacteria bacterium]|nr:malonate decarboxylase subunit alpha [Gammaproteobacteria bacterium]
MKCDATNTDSGHNWFSRRQNKERRMSDLSHLVDGSIIPTENIVAAMEQLIKPGDKV